MSERPKLMKRDFEAEAARITPAYRPKQVEKTAPCQVGCANCGDIRGWIGTIAQRDKMGISREEAYTRAWRMITDVNPFPSVLGRVCPHPCEQHCNRSEKDEPLAINAMERFLGDWAIDHNIPLQQDKEGDREEWIGVVGAGPSGLSFAYQMARRGYRVTIYERREKAGGMLRYGVPDYRLPQDVLDAEVQRILDLGVELNLNTAVGRDISLQQLRDRHAALYLGIGAQMGRALGVPGEPGSSVWTGTDYLSRVNRGEVIEVGERVLVVGGGNSAVDAARTARRAGAEVSILYRRSRQEMPAIEHELEDALEEGVRLEELVAPVRIIRDDSEALIAVEICRMELLEPDASGRRRPQKIPGSEFTMEADALISAISQRPVLKGLEALNHDGSWLVAHAAADAEDNILAGGDALGLGIAGNAIVQGRRAAEELHGRYSGDRPARPEEVRPEIGPENVKFGYKADEPAARAPTLPGEERVEMGSAEVTGTIDEAQFLAETERCYSCGSCFGCEQCFMYCTTGCFTRVEEATTGVYFTLALDECHECGKCIEVCPCGFLEVS
jgi:NADPH-dependent glutamate synthase beta subunit-like oxidoreductase/NAD-dependent dihydropyrimidine dehydrogenase PreA subunit